MGTKGRTWKLNPEQAEIRRSALIKARAAHKLNTVFRQLNNNPELEVSPSENDVLTPEISFLPPKLTKAPDNVKINEDGIMVIHLPLDDQPLFGDDEQQFINIPYYPEDPQEPETDSGPDTN